MKGIVYIHPLLLVIGFQGGFVIYVGLVVATDCGAFYFFLILSCKFLFVSFIPAVGSDQAIWSRVIRSADGKGPPSNSDSPVHTPKKVLAKLNSLKMGPFKSQNSVVDVSNIHISFNVKKCYWDKLNPFFFIPY